VIRIIVFDFDGVIVDSNELKFKDVWKRLFSLSPEISYELIERAKPRGTRYDALRFIAFEIDIPKEEIEAWVEACANEYNDIVQEGIVETGLFSGVYNTLKELTKNHTLYLNSATPTIALKESVDALAIGEFFADVCGKPQSKAENLKEIITREHADLDTVLFVGDGEADRKAAEEIGCQFVGIPNKWNSWRDDSGFPLIKDVAALPAFISDVELRCDNKKHRKSF